MAADSHEPRTRAVQSSCTMTPWKRNGEDARAAIVSRVFGTFFAYNATLWLLSF